MTGTANSAVDVMRGALAYVDAWLEYRLWKLAAPGAQVAVWFDGEIQFSKAYGFSNLDTQEPLTTAHLFRIASHSKTFTATAVMQLVEAGKLRLDDTAGTWIPELAAAGSPVASTTVRELVSNSAGIIRDGLDANFWAHDRPFLGDAELLEIAIREGAVRQPEAAFKYSNIGFSLLGMIVGKAAGTSYNEYVSSAIVEALGLHDTGPELDPARIAEFAGGHSGVTSRSDRQVIPHVDTHSMAAATGFYSTAEDLVRFASAHMFGDDRLISDRSKNEMQRPIWSGFSPGAPLDGYGYGTIIHHYDGRKTVGHAGGYPGHITRTFWDPAEGLAISVLTNAVDGPAEELAAGVLRILEKSREVPSRLPLTSGLTDSAAIPAPAAPAAEIDPHSFTGRFAALWGVTDVCLLGGKLYASTPEAPAPLTQSSELAMVDANTLRIMTGSPYGSVGEHFRYERDADGAIVSVFTGGMRAWPIEVYRSRPDLI